MDYPHNDQSLAFEFLGRVCHLESKYPICIKPLIEGAIQWYDKTPGLYLVPQRSCFPLPGEPLRTTLTGHKSMYLQLLCFHISYFKMIKGILCDFFFLTLKQIVFKINIAPITNLFPNDHMSKHYRTCVVGYKITIKSKKINCMQQFIFQTSIVKQLEPRSL